MTYSVELDYVVSGQTLFDVHFKEDAGDEWRCVQISGETIKDVPANFMFAYGGVYRPLSECEDFDIRLSHVLSADCWCEPEYVGDGVYVHKEPS